MSTGYAALGERLDDTLRYAADDAESRLIALGDLFATRPHVDTAYEAVEQAAAMVRAAGRSPAWPAGYYPVVDAAFLRPGARAYPAPLSSVVSTVGPHLFADVAVDVVVEDRVVTFPAGTPMTVLSVTRAGEGGLLAAPVMLDVSEPGEVVALTRDGYRGPATVRDDGTVDLPRPVSGSTERDPAWCALMPPGTADPHAAIEGGATATAALAAAGPLATLDLLMPFPVDVLRRATLGTTADELRDALAAAGRAGFACHGEHEISAVRYLVERIAKGTVAAGSAPIEAVAVSVSVPSRSRKPAAQAVLSRGDAARLAAFALVAVPEAPVEFSVRKLRGAAEVEAAAAHSNAAAARLTLETPTVVPVDPPAVQAPPLERVADDKAVAATFVADADELVFDTGGYQDRQDRQSPDAAAQGTEADVPGEEAEVRGAEAEVRRAFAEVLDAAALLPEPAATEASVARVLEAAYARVPDGRRLDAAAARHVAALGAVNAAVVARDELSLLAMTDRGTRGAFLAAVAAECVVNTVEASVAQSRVAVSRMSDSHAALFKPTLVGLSTYVSAVLQDAGALERGSGPKVAGLAAAGAGRLPPSTERLMAALDVRRKNLPTAELWAAAAVAGVDAPRSGTPLPVLGPVGVFPDRPRADERPWPAKAADGVEAVKPPPAVSAPRDTSWKRADLRVVGKLPSYLKSVLAGDGADAAARRRHAARVACPAVVALLRVRVPTAAHHAFSQGSKRGVDVLAGLSAAKRASGARVNALTVSSDGDDAARLSRFVKALHGVAPSLVPAFSEYAELVYRPPLGAVAAYRYPSGGAAGAGDSAGDAGDSAGDAGDSAGDAGDAAGESGDSAGAAGDPGGALDAADTPGDGDEIGYDLGADDSDGDGDD